MGGCRRRQDSGNSCVQALQPITSCSVVILTSPIAIHPPMFKRVFSGRCYHVGCTVGGQRSNFVFSVPLLSYMHEVSFVCLYDSQRVPTQCQNNALLHRGNGFLSEVQLSPVSVTVCLLQQLFRFGNVLFPYLYSLRFLYQPSLTCQSVHSLIPQTTVGKGSNTTTLIRCCS